MKIKVKLLKQTDKVISELLKTQHSDILDEKILIKLKDSYISIILKIMEANNYDDSFNSPYVEIKSNIFDSIDIIVEGKRLQYPYFMDILKQNELIYIRTLNGKEVYSNFEGGEFFKSYRLSNVFYEIDIDDYFTNYHYIDYEINITPYQKKYSNIEKKEIKQMRKDYSNIYKHLEKISIIEDEYFDFLTLNEGRPVKSKLDIQGNIIQNTLDKKRIMNYYYNALRLNYGEKNISKSESGRIFSPITNISNLALPFLIYDKKEHLTSIDVVNCQPLLLSTLIDYEEFKYDCERGAFYDTLVNYCRKYNYFNPLINPNKHRDIVKLSVFKYIMFSKNIKKEGSFQNIVNKAYPQLLDKIIKLTSIKEKTLAFLLQNIESEIFIENIVRNEKRFCLSKHDEIIIRIKDVKYFEKRIIEEFRKKGLEVTLK